MGGRTFAAESTRSHCGGTALLSDRRAWTAGLGADEILGMMVISSCNARERDFTSTISGEHPQVVDVAGHGAVLWAPMPSSRQEATRHLSSRVPLNLRGATFLWLTRLLAWDMRGEPRFCAEEERAVAASNVGPEGGVGRCEAELYYEGGVSRDYQETQEAGAETRGGAAVWMRSLQRGLQRWLQRGHHAARGVNVSVREGVYCKKYKNVKHI